MAEGPPESQRQFTAPEQPPNSLRIDAEPSACARVGAAALSSSLSTRMPSLGFVRRRWGIAVLSKGRVLIAVPCAHGLVKMAATQTIAEAALAMQRQGYEVPIAMISVSNIVMGRNRLAALALYKQCSHILFIDSDMGIPANLIVDMMKADRDVIGLIYPKRKLDLQELLKIGRDNPELADSVVIAKSLEYIFKGTGSAMNFTNGLGEVAGLGMGGTLIKTSALQAIAEAGLVQRRPEHGDALLPEPWGFFDLMQDANGVELGEDLSFCARWRQAGGAVWALSAPGVRHVGDFDYAGDMLASHGVRNEPARE
jgi:hypothetical protein